MKKTTEKFYIGRPNIGNRSSFTERIDKIFERHWLTNDGQYVRELEQKLANYLGVKHCVAISNGTVALELAIRALGIEGNCIVPSMTFIATAHALKWQGIEPIFADINPQSYNVCVTDIERCINEQTTGIIAVHLYGRPAEVEKLQTLADKYDLRLMFDAAHAFGVSHNDKMIGCFGECEVFSFHATKVFNTFEGGAVTTQNDELAEKLRHMRNFGFVGEDQVSYLGTNGKMSEMNAAMGLTNLESIDHFIQVNLDNYQAFKQGLEGVGGIELIEYDVSQRNNYQYVIIEVDETEFGCSRDNLKDYLTDNGVFARRYFYPGCHRMEPYCSNSSVDLNLPNTEQFATRMLALPTGTQINQNAVLDICKMIKDFKRNKLEAD